MAKGKQVTRPAGELHGECRRCHVKGDTQTWPQVDLCTGCFQLEPDYPVAGGLVPLPAHSEAMPNGRVLAPLAGGEERHARIATSLDMKKPEERLAAYRAIQTQDKAGLDMLNQPLQLRHWLCHDITLTDPETGEVSDAVRTVLILEDGTRVGFVSDGLLKSLKAIEAFFGPAPWTPAIRGTVKQINSRSGRRFYTIDVG